MDRITKTILDDFIRANSLESEAEDSAFEHFVATLVVGKHHTESISSFDVVTAAGGDTGIDALGIIANGTFVINPEEVQDLIEINGYIDVKFVFIQVERSEGFATSKIVQ